MKRRLFSVPGILLLPFLVLGQPVTSRLATAYRQFEQDPQMKYAIGSLYVIDAKTGRVVFEKNAHTGLAPASTQKIVTSVTALALLGSGFHYTTTMGYSGEIGPGGLEGNLVLAGSGDPTFGSWRFSATKEESILKSIRDSLVGAGIHTIKSGGLVVDEHAPGAYEVPGGWLWEDMGNYYGGGAGSVNWRENQYDLVLRSGNRIGSAVNIVETNPLLYDISFSNNLKAGSPNSGDQAYIYLGPNMTSGWLRGTIPVDQKRFVISGSFPRPAWQFTKTLAAYLEAQDGFQVPHVDALENDVDSVSDLKIIFHHDSPGLDSIIYWLNRKSINLYAEALLKTLAFVKSGDGLTEKGVEVVREFWKNKGIDPGELNLYDGSGLSPMNRVTTHAQVEILKFARAQEWFPVFRKSLPEFNGMTMKSGTIGDVKGFTGYHHSKDRHEYIFSFLVNNYNGSSSALVRKMYRVLDQLK